MRTAPIEPTRTAPETQPMEAIVQDEYGPVAEDVLRLAEVAVPSVGATDVLVRVRAASVDRGTWHIMAGLPYAAAIRYLREGRARGKVVIVV